MLNILMLCCALDWLCVCVGADMFKSCDGSWRLRWGEEVRWWSRSLQKEVNYQYSCSWLWHGVLPALDLYHWTCSRAHRYRTYVTQTMPIIDKFEKRGLVRTISAVPGPEKASLQCHAYCRIACSPKENQVQQLYRGVISLPPRYLKKWKNCFKDCDCILF